MKVSELCMNILNHIATKGDCEIKIYNADNERYIFIDNTEVVDGNLILNSSKSINNYK